MGRPGSTNATSPREIARGRADVGRSVGDVVAAFDSAAVGHPVAFAAGDQAVDSRVRTGRYTGMPPCLPTGKGEAVTNQGLTLIVLPGGAIRRTTDYDDQDDILAQLGALQPLEPIGSPEATSAD